MQSKYKFSFSIEYVKYYSQIVNNVYLLFKYESDKYCELCSRIIIYIRLYTFD